MESAPMETGVAVVTQPTVVSSTAQTPAPAGLGARARDRRKTPAFLSNLGKPTLRGIRKCPQCGVFNGTRGLSCKNKACGAVFRDGGAAGGRGLKKGGAEVVRLRGRGPEQRGFVELALTDTAIATADGTVLTRVSVGRCFLPACRQGRGQAPSAPQGRGEGPADARPRPPQRPDSPCTHVKQAMECHAQATPLPLKSSVLESLQAPAQAKEDLWQLATESPGPLVQRVSRGTLVVKCHVSDAHPLGLLHLTVGAPSGAARGEGKIREGQPAHFHCACQASNAKRGSGARAHGDVVSGEEGQSKVRDPGVMTSLLADAPSLPPPYSSYTPEVCLHFYACVCAFASDEKLATEFSAFLNYDANGLQVNTDCAALCAASPQVLSEPSALHRSKRVRLEEAAPVTASALAARDSLPAPPLRKGGHRKQPISTTLKSPGNSQPVDETHVSLPFQQWLASVTERIHQTMHFQFDGKPEPLVFHIPQAFFNALQQRLSLGSKKRRLPNSTTAFVRNDALPLGTFSKYTWHITNLLQVKRIFDTPELPLELTQSFVKNRDGSFSPFRCPEAPPETVTEGCGRGERPQAIRPLELRTFLKVGTSTPEQKEPTPFVIEWIPDILPRSRVGELRIRFEYGHQLGGQPDFCDGVAGRAGGAAGSSSGGGAGGGAAAAAEAAQSLPAPTIEILRVSVP
ncbi:hypothetical protein MATL_G00083350 [Megalops atlanticus]|uniref:Putative treble-clef zinc-finger domain-containing protein n=1 Tax=Megalops atlanticus TaxID=7932 RepID=A0A9D3Q7P6_MEGAT|nr:hypothetical protein MATL_G00083350 [Megalops atlanticus]